MAKATKVVVREYVPGGRCHTKLLPNPNRVANAVAVRCGAKDCMEEFQLAKPGNPGSYNLAAYERHLRDDHGIFLPKAIIVLKDWTVKQR